MINNLCKKQNFSCDKLIASGDFCMGMMVIVLLLNYQRSYDCITAKKLQKMIMKCSDIVWQRQHVAKNIQCKNDTVFSVINPCCNSNNLAGSTITCVNIIIMIGIVVKDNR